MILFPTGVDFGEAVFMIQVRYIEKEENVYTVCIYEAAFIIANYLPATLCWSEYSTQY
jgi:hypothetical protein